MATVIIMCIFFLDIMYRYNYGRYKFDIFREFPSERQDISNEFWTRKSFVSTRPETFQATLVKILD